MRPHRLRRVGVVPGVELVEGGDRVLGRGLVARRRAATRRCGAPPSCRGRCRPSPCAPTAPCRRRRRCPDGPVIMLGPTSTVPSLSVSPGTPSSSDRSTSWPSASTSESDSSVSNSPVGCGKPLSSSFIFSTVSVPSSVMLRDRRQPLDEHALLQRLLELEVVRRHLLARAAVDDDRLARAQPLRGARDVERGVAAAVDDDPPAEHRLLLALHAAQHRHRVEHVRRLARGNVRALGDVRADGEERGVEAALRHRRRGCSRPWCSSSSSTPMSRMRAISASSTSRGRRYFGMPKRIMPPAIGPASTIFTRVAEAAQVIGGGQPRGPRADDQHALAGRLLAAGRTSSLASAPRRPGSARPS